jgi:hypothetical protein
MSSKCFIFVLSLLLAPRVCLAAENWMVEVEQKLASAETAKGAVAYLDALPLATKQTSDFQWAMARAAMAVGEVRLASRSIIAYEMLLVPNPKRDFTVVKRWLSQKGVEEHKLALEALKKGDKLESIRHYLVAVRCDQAVLGLDDHKLRKASKAVLDKLVQAKPDEIQRWQDLAFYSYFFGDIKGAKAALEQVQALAKDPYMIWFMQRALTRVNMELDQQAQLDAADAAHDAEKRKQLDEQYAKEDAAQQVREDHDREAARQYTAQRAAQINAELASVDSRLQTLEQQRAGQVAVSTDGTPVVLAVNQRVVKEQMERLQESKAQLEAERDGLR